MRQVRAAIAVLVIGLFGLGIQASPARAVTPTLMTLSGHIVDVVGNGDLASVIVTAMSSTGNPYTATIDVTNSYTVQVPVGQYSVRMNKYFNESFQIDSALVNVSAATVVNITVPSRTRLVHAVSSTGKPVAAHITLLGGPTPLPVVPGQVPLTVTSWSSGADSAGTAVSMRTFDTPATAVIVGTSVPYWSKSIVLSPADPQDLALSLPALVNISGLVVDKNGAPTTGVKVALVGNGPGAEGLLDQTGHYSFAAYIGSYAHVTLRGDYIFTGARSTSAPLGFYLVGGPLTISGNTTLNLAVPAVPVSLHIRDADGLPIASNIYSDNLAVGLPLAGVHPSLPFVLDEWLEEAGRESDFSLHLFPGNTTFRISPIGLPDLISTFQVSATGPNDITITLPANPADPPAAFTPLVPGRLLDTRGAGTVDGHSDWSGLVRAGQTVELSVDSRGDVSADASAVVLNVTVTGAQQAGFVTVWPCGSAMPNASSLNFGVGETIPNAVVARVGTGGKVCLNSTGTTHLLADVTGYFPAGSDYEPLTPARLLDTRGPGTIDGQSEGLGLIPAGRTVELPVTSRGGVPNSVSAVVLNVTVTGAKSAGFVTVWPCGSPMPNASTVNFSAGGTIPNAVFAMVGSGGKVCLNTSAATHLLADVDGYVPTGSSYQPLIPARLLDSRGGGTIDGLGATPGIIPAGKTVEVVVGGRGHAPADASAAVLNVTVTGAKSAGFVTVWPCGTPMPNASSLNFGPGETIANAVVTQLGTDGKVCLSSTAATHLLTDLNGIFPASA
jgi:hypothetical protein